MREIQLTRGQVAVIDDEYFEILNQHKWHARKGRGDNYYAVRADYSTGKHVQIQMHREVFGGLLKTDIIDHIDGCGLNNLRTNLRKCTIAQNAHNMRPRLNMTSIYKGVSKYRNGWYVAISHFGKREFLGMYASEIEAAKAYDAAAMRLHGDFARLNFPSACS